MRKIVCLCIVFCVIIACASSGGDYVVEGIQKNEAITKDPANLIIENPKESMEQNLIINTIPEKYSYNQFLNDLHQIESIYGDCVKINKLTDTADGREIYDLLIGEIEAPKHILIFGAMHGREYITSQVVMRQLCLCLDALQGKGGEYRGIPVGDLLNGVAIHFIPFSNPDGVTISQFGANSLVNGELREAVFLMSRGDEAGWKANARGVDLNRNFDAEWHSYNGVVVPGPERYKGIYPGSECESAALIQLTQQYPVKRTISYHSCGALIYWYFKQSGHVLTESKRFAEVISEETGYYLDDDYTSVDAAGYKDWAVYKMGIPSLTIEVGAEEGRTIENPVPIERFGNIWSRNRNVVFATVYNLKYD